MKIAMLLALYTGAFLWGCTKLRGRRRGLHRLWLGCILLWCVYVHICGITGTPHLSISSLYTAYFQPAGRSIIQWLGG